MLATKGHSLASLKKSRLEGIELLSKMSIQPRINTPRASTTAHLGKASDYQKCVARAKPSANTR